MSSILLSNCAVGPYYQRPSIAIPEHFSAEQNWVPAAPADALNRGHWWQLFNDSMLTELENNVEVSNQNVLVAKAAYDQARSLVAQTRAATLPSVNLSASASRGDNNLARNPVNQYQVAIGSSWEPDLWGSLGRESHSAKASAQASEADLISATLSAQGELAIDYLSLRQMDVQVELLAKTVETYQRSAQITENRFHAGAVAKTDVLQAKTQLDNARANLLSLQRQREQFEHAIAVLIGKVPEEFHLAIVPNWQVSTPQIPLGLPSELLQRRPDIASAERRVAAASEQIGVAKAGYFPNVKLTATDGNSATALADLMKSSVNVWTFGASVAQNVFDAGATAAKVESAKAVYQQSVAHYRQTVLSAFQNVEDELTAIRILLQQQTLYAESSAAADQVEQQAMNRYRLGQISFNDVVNAQTTALTARRALAQANEDNQIASIALIQALGGGWAESF